MGALTITTLGVPRILHADAPATFTVRKALALTLYLAVTGQPHTRASLIALLWPDADEPHGLLNLRQTLLRIRQALAPDGATHLRATGDLVSLDLGGGTVNLTRFAAATQAHALSDEMLAALRSYEGPFLEHVEIDDAPDFMAWVAGQRAHWDACFDLIAERHMQRLMDEGSAEDASALGQRWILLRPDAEVAHRMLATAQAAAGDLGAARLTLSLAARHQEALGLPLSLATKTVRAQLDAASAASSAQTDAAASGSTASPVNIIQLPLVGRREAFIQVRQAYTHALEGASGILLTQGEAGVGKSRLSIAFVRWAQAQGADIAVGHAYELSGRLSYQPLMEALRIRLAAEHAPDDLLEDSWLIELQRLVPDLHDRYPDLPPPVDDAAAGARLVEAVAQLGIALARRRPLVWLVEDLHWADEATRAALLYLVNRWRAEQAPALLMVTIRSEEIAASPELESWYMAARQSSLSTEIALTRLTAAQTTHAITTLFGDDVRPEVFAWLYATTQGNPLFLEHVVQSLVERSAASWGEDGTLRIAEDVDGAALSGWLPETLRELLLRRVRRLPVTTQQTLAAAAVLGGRFDEATLLPVAGVDEDTLVTALEAAERSQFIRAEAGQYVFTHDAVAETLASDLTLARRRVFHRRALQTLEAGRTTSPADLARLALGAHAWEQAATYSQQAAEAAEQIGAHRDALRFYEQVVALISTPPSKQAIGSLFTDKALWELYGALGISYLTLGEHEQARALYARALEDARARGAHALEGRVLFMMGRQALQHDFDFATARSLFEKARQIAGDHGDIEGLVHIERMLAVTAEELGDVRLAETYIQHAVRLARDSQQGLAQVLLQASAVAGSLGRWDAACAAAEECLILFAASLDAEAMAETPVDAPPYQFVMPLAWTPFAHRIVTLSHARPTREYNLARRWGANGLIWMGNARLHLGEGATGRAALDMAWQIFSARNERRFHQHYLLHRTFGLTEVGAYEHALEEAQQTLAAMQTTAEQPIDPTNVMPLCAMVDLHQALFQLDEARAPLEQALSFAVTKTSKEQLLAAARQCTQHALSGEWEAAYSAALQAQALRDALPSPLAWFDFARYYETEALVRAGDRARAHAHAEHLGDHLDGNRRYRVLYLRMRAVLDRDAGDHIAATAHLTEALELATQMELPGEVWQIAGLLAESYAGQHDTLRAHDALTHAANVISVLASQITVATLRDHFTAAAHARLPAVS